MESIQIELNVIKNESFMASIDLKGAFCSVPVAAHYQKYLSCLCRRLVLTERLL